MNKLHKALNMSQLSRSNRSNFTWLILLIGLAVFSYWGYETISKKSLPTTSQQATVEVEVITLEEHENKIYKQLSGRVSAYKIAEIRPQVGGIVKERLFKEGAFVEQGQRLYQIDSTPYIATYNAAKVDFDQALANRNRFAELIKINAVSQQEYDEAKTTLAQAEASLEVAKVNLDYTNVYAPISGYIGKSSVTQGALVTANQVDPIATITQLDPIYVDMILPANELIRLKNISSKNGDIAVNLLDVDGNQIDGNKGTLQFSEVNVNKSTGTVVLRAIFPNLDSQLLPGMFVRTELHLDTKKAILIPQEATVRNANGTLSAWVVDENHKVQPKTIKTAGSIDNKWLIETGVESGDIIVTKGFQKIRPGMVVKTVEKPTTGE